MSVAREPGTAARRDASHAAVAALPLAAAATLVVARFLPVGFEYRPNELGIVSVTTVTRYPLQQETFWYVFGVGFGVAAALAIAAALRTRAWSGARGIALEAAAAATLAALVLLPAGVAALALVPLAAVVALAWRAPRVGASPHDAAPVGAAHAAATAAAGPLDETDEDGRELPRRRTPGWARACIAVAALALVLAASPTLPIHLWQLASGVPDADLTVDDWRFHGESGQHLAWADALREGRMQGRDYFSLYGPYFDLGLVGLWALVGRSIAAWNVYDAAQFALGWLGALALCLVACRRRWVALVLAALARIVFLRYALGLVALAALVPWLRNRERGDGRPAARWCGVAGLAGGFALLYSQEFGVAFLACAALALLVRGERRALAWFAGGLALPVAPIVAWFAAEGALAPLLRDMAGYPAWLAAGYGKLPFPSLLAALPLDVVPPLQRGDAFARTAYVAPAVCAGAFALCACAAPLEPRRPWRLALALREAWRARPDTLVVALVALYGLVAYRSALGRSDEPHVVFVLGAPAILLVLALDRALPLLRGERALGAWRLACVAALAWFGGFPRAAGAPAALREGAAAAWSVATGRVEPARGSEEVNAVAEWLVARTQPGDGVTFVPAGAAYHYLVRRRDPTRFVLSHQMVTDAHRAEALADLERSPPRFVVFDPGALRVDGVPDRVVLGPALSDWLAREYELDATVHGVRIHRRKGAPPSDRAGPVRSGPARDR